MGNMSYCRFENTYKDLQDCYEALGSWEEKELSKSEERYKKYLIKMCKDIADEFGEDNDEDNE